MTPTTIYGRSSSRSVYPMTDRRRSNARSHRRSPISTTWAPFGRSSSAVKVLPAIGWSPSSRKGVCRYLEHRQPHRIAVVGTEIDLSGHDCREILEGAASCFEVDEVRKGRRLACGAGIAIGLPHHGQSIQVLQRRGAQQHRIDDAEDRRVCANAQRQRDDDDRRQRRRFPEGPYRIAKVRQHVPALTFRLRQSPMRPAFARRRRRP